MGTAAELLGVLDDIAPFSLAEDWDNVGLIAGSTAWTTTGPALLAIDLTPAVAEEAIALGAGAVMAYHPPIFGPTRRLTDDSGRTGAILDLLAARIAIISPHTALDAAEGGVADFLADIVAPGCRRTAITPHLAHRSGGTHKLVTFVPRAAVEAVRTAMAAAGAGVIGDYTECAFMTDGRGSFRGSPDSNPTIGTPGKLEFVEEVRLEMVCPGIRLAPVIAALTEAHPYEEPPVDIHPVAPVPSAALGAGRIARSDEGLTLSELSDRITKGLGVSALQIADASPGAKHHLIAVCPGAGSSLLDAVASAGATVFLTGEMRHHDVLAALGRGVSVILAGHTETERPYLPVLARKISERSPALAVAVSKADRSPFAV